MVNGEIIRLPVEPYDRISNRRIGSIFLAIESLELFKGVSLRITYMDINDVYVESEIITLSTDDYRKWGTDDTFIYNYISEKKGFIIKPPTIIMTTVPVASTGGSTGTGDAASTGGSTGTGDAASTGGSTGTGDAASTWPEADATEMDEPV